MKVLVTGGAGFIGSHFVRHLLTRRDIHLVLNLDKLTYAGHLENLRDVAHDKRYRFVRGDIASAATVERCVGQVDAIVNFAAETHVDRSIHDAAPFLTTNVIGTQVLVAAAKARGIPRFVQISTDEVYGSIPTPRRAKESDVLDPSSPYSASKAASDHVALSYFRTFRTPVMITRAANNYGPFQYPEKFLPLFITHALEDQPLPLYGDGKNVREWLHVSDHCEAIERVLRKGTPGEIYNIGTEQGVANIDVVRRLLKRLGKSDRLVRFVPDRLGHDRRYAMNCQKMRRELGWKPRIGFFEQGLDQLIDWYLEHRPWWERILHGSKAYRRYYTKQYARKAR